MKILRYFSCIKRIQTLRPNIRLHFNKSKTFSQERLSQKHIEALTQGKSWRAGGGCVCNIPENYMPSEQPIGL